MLPGTNPQVKSPLIGACGGSQQMTDKRSTILAFLLPVAPSLILAGGEVFFRRAVRLGLSCGNVLVVVLSTWEHCPD